MLIVCRVDGKLLERVPPERQEQRGPDRHILLALSVFDYLTPPEHTSDLLLQQLGVRLMAFWVVLAIASFITSRRWWECI